MKKATLFILSFVFHLNFTAAQINDSLELLMPVSHKYVIERVALSDNGRYIATGANDGYIKIWDARSGTIIHTIGESRLDGVGIGSLCFTPDGKYLLSGLLNVDIWDVATGKSVNKLPTFTGAYCYSIDISPDSKTALIGCGDPVLWDINSGKSIRAFAHPAIVSCVKFSKDATKFLSGWNDGAVRLYDTASSEIVKEIKLTTRKIYAVTFSNDEKEILFSDEDGKIYLCDKNTGNLIKSYEGRAMRDRSLVFTPDNNSILVADYSKIKKIDIKSGKSTVLLPYDNLNDIAYSKDQKRVLLPVIGGESFYGTTDVSIRDLQSGASVREFNKSKFSAIQSVTFSPDNRTLATVIGRSQIRIINLSNITSFRTIKSNNVHALHFSPDTKLLAFGNGVSSDEFLSVTDLASPKTIWSVPMPDRISGISFSGDNKLMAVGLITGSVRIIDLATRSTVLSFRALREGANKLFFSTDNNLLLFATQSSLEVFNISSNKREWYYPRDVPLNEQKFPKVNLKRWGPEARSLIEMFKNEPYASHYYEQISADGKTIYVSRDRASFEKKDIQSGTSLKFTGHQGVISSLSVSDDNKLVASTANDNTLRVWDNATGKTLVSYFAMDSSDWFWLTPDNYYYSSRNGSRAVSFRKSNQVYRFHQFDLQLNRPDLVMKNIGLSSDSLVSFYSKLVEKRLRTMGIPADAMSSGFSVPVIDIINFDSIPDITTTPSVNLNVRVASPNEDLKKINIWINSVPVYNAAVDKNKAVSGNTFQAWYNVPLIEGKNVIEVSGLNQSGKESLIASVQVTYTPLVKEKPDLYIVSIGISEYQKYPLSRLKYADKDAINLAEKFSSSTLFGNVHLDTLTNSHANRANILKIKNTFMKARPNDLVILSFSGHGIVDSSLNFYFCTNEIDLNRIAATAISFKEMENLLDSISSYKKMLLIDACYSGEVDKEVIRTIIKNDSTKALHVSDAKPLTPVNVLKFGQQRTFELIKESFLDLRRRTGAIVISSSSGVDVSYEKDKWENGLFTYAILSALADSQGIDLNGDGLYVSELIPYLVQSVKDLSGGLQVPTIREENIDFDFRIW